jgi:hypothetical protein
MWNKQLYYFRTLYYRKKPAGGEKFSTWWCIAKYQILEGYTNKEMRTDIVNVKIVAVESSTWSRGVHVSTCALSKGRILIACILCQVDPCRLLQKHSTVPSRASCGSKKQWRTPSCSIAFVELQTCVRIQNWCVDGAFRPRERIRKPRL